MRDDLQTFDFSVHFDASRDRVFGAFWSLADWPAVAPHVRRIEMHFEDDSTQVLTMHVETRGRHDAFQTVRVRQQDSIFFIQPRPPALLRRHWGWWHVLGSDSGTEVRSEHTVQVEPVGAERFLRSIGVEAASAEDVTVRLIEIIRNNSRQTMLALKEKLEQQVGTATPAAVRVEVGGPTSSLSGPTAPAEGGVEP